MSFPSEPVDLNELLRRHAGNASLFQKAREQMLFQSNIGVGAACFENIGNCIEILLESYPAVAGCVAWLTDIPILETLASLDVVSIVINKEDFLRPDGADSNWASELRRRYGKLAQPNPRLGRLPGMRALKALPGAAGPASIRCVGAASPSEDRFGPRMHHKFLVFLDYVKGTLVPKALLTGSFNITATSRRSLENILFIDDERFAQIYYDEFFRVFLLSEPLDWISDSVSPSYSV